MPRACPVLCADLTTAGQGLVTEGAGGRAQGQNHRWSGRVGRGLHPESQGSSLLRGPRP